jgi:hypothetical protein
MAVAQVQLSTRVALAKPQILIQTSIQVEAKVAPWFLFVTNGTIL